MPSMTAPEPTPRGAFPRADLPRRARLDDLARALEAKWKERRSAHAHPLADFARIADAEPAAIFETMAPHLVNPSWIAAQLDEALALMHADSFATPPLRAFQRGALTGVVLAEAGQVSLSLMVRRWEASAPGGTPHDASQPAPEAVTFSSGHSLTVFLTTGGASITRYSVALTPSERAGLFSAATAAPCRCEGSKVLVAGDIERVDLMQQCDALSGGTGDTVMLQLLVAAPCAVPVRAHDAATGALLSLASASRTGSYRQMTLGLLRIMRRRDAGPQFAAALSEPDFALRWQVMREFIALDPLAALPHLITMSSDDPHPEVRRSATAARDIVETALAAHRQKESV
jgi:hypothetical protein